MLAVAVRPEARRHLDALAVGRLRRWFRAMLAACGVSGAELSVVLCGDDEIHDLNRRFRRKDKPTDVLSFSLREGLPLFAPGSEAALGDVVISVETARRVRHERGATVEEEIAFLFSHGLCHLLGYDHQTDAEEAVMNTEAARLRGAARVRKPRR
jgi:probable rRNA maturation factor